jgi:5,5'-dehydrodivanillate O-demethylase
MPFEPACLPLKIAAYSVEAFAGIVWAYMGPQPAPLLPHWDYLFRDDLDRQLSIRVLPCNWLQCMDNSLDPVHFEHLHGVYGNYMMKKLGQPAMLNPAQHLKIEFDVFEYGIYKRRLLEGSSEDDPDWTIGHPILFPCILAQGGRDRGNFQIRTPVDDSHTLHVCIVGARPGPGEALRAETPVIHEPLEYDALGRVFAPYIVRQDEMAWVAQGPVTDRTTEHLASSDRGILLYRKLLLENIERVERGEDPMGVIRDPSRNHPMIAIRRGTEYEAFHRGVAAENYGGVWEGVAAAASGA